MKPDRSGQNIMYSAGEVDDPPSAIEVSELERISPAHSAPSAFDPPQADAFFR